MSSRVVQVLLIHNPQEPALRIARSSRSCQDPEALPTALWAWAPADATAAQTQLTAAPHLESARSVKLLDATAESGVTIAELQEQHLQLSADVQMMQAQMLELQRHMKLAMADAAHWRQLHASAAH